MQHKEVQHCSMLFDKTGPVGAIDSALSVIYLLFLIGTFLVLTAVPIGVFWFAWTLLR